MGAGGAGGAYRALEHVDAGGAGSREQPLALLAVAGMERVAEGEGDPDALVQALVLRHLLRHAAGELGDPLLRRRTRLREQHPELGLGQAGRDVEVPELSAQRLGGTPHHPVEPDGVGGAADLVEVGEPADHHREGVLIGIGDR